MKSVLTGASGQLGTDIVRTRPGWAELIPTSHLDLDITREASVRKFLQDARPDIVFNAAAYVRVDDAEDNADEAFRVNAVGAKHIASACVETGAELLHISTDYVFDGARQGTPYTEDDVPNPINAYGISKYAGELFVRNYCTRHYIFRSASLYGRAGASGKGGNFLFTIIRKARSGEPLRIVSDIIMSPAYTLDLACGIWDFIRDPKPYGTYHMTNAGDCSWFRFAQRALEIAGISADISPVSHTEYRTRARRPLNSSLASSRGVELRHWEPALRDFLQEAL